MVIVSLSGGLGNQLFQFATGYSLSKRLNQKLIVDASFFSRKHPDDTRQYSCILNNALDIDNLSVINNIWVSRILRLFCKALDIVTFSYFKYSNLQENIVHKNSDFKIFRFYNITKADNYFLNGYWQNLDYLSDCMHKIVKLFKIKKVEYNKPVIGIHVRKGDIKNSSMDIISSGYYEAGILKIIELRKYDIKNVELKIFTEDGDWVKQNINLVNYKVSYVVGDYLNPVNDFFNLAVCSDIVIPNSTFSWWAAMVIYFNDPKAVIIYPDPWFPGVETESINLFPSSWIKLNSL